MRRLIFDQFEFDTPASEESLELWIAAKGDIPYPDMWSFVVAVNAAGPASALPPPIPFSDSFGYGMVREYLSRYAAVPVPTSCSWPTYVLLDDDLEWDGIFDAEGMFIRYHWLSTA